MVLTHARCFHQLVRLRIHQLNHDPAIPLDEREVVTTRTCRDKSLITIFIVRDATELVVQNDNIIPALHMRC